MTAIVPSTGPAPERAPRPSRRPGEHLRPVRRPGARRSPAVPVLVGAGIVIAALFALAVMHALLIGGQLRLDDVQQAVAAETEEIHRLRLRVAELESPDRVLAVARKRLGMVQPTEVGYLPPVEVDTGDTAPVRVAPAEVVAPDPVVTDRADADADTETDTEDDDEPAAGTDDGEASAGGDDEVIGSSVEEDATTTDGSAEETGTEATEPVTDGGDE